MNATLSTAPSRHDLTRFGNPYAECARQIQTVVYVVLRDSDGAIYKRVSRQLNDTPEDRELAARIIRAGRAKAAAEGWELRFGIERISGATAVYRAGQRAARRGAFRILACPATESELREWNAGFDSVRD